MRKNLTLGLCFVGILAVGLFAFTFTQSIAAGALGGTPLYLPVILRQVTPSNTPTVTRTPMPTPTITRTPTKTPTITQTPTASDTPTITNTPTETGTPTETPTPTETNTPGPANLSITALSGSTMPEYVTITNSGGTSQDMTGWTIVSVVGPQTYPFPDSYILGAGASVRVESYNGASNNPPTVLFWDSNANWNNAGDKAELRSDSNALIDSECYGSGCP